MKKRKEDPKKSSFLYVSKVDYSENFALRNSRFRRAM